MFQKATKKQAKLRCAIAAPAGGGKTYSALSIASGMGSKIAVIDTEKGSASKYSDRFTFDVLELEYPYSIQSYIQGIKAAEEAGYEVLIIDSLTHAWDFLLEMIDKLAHAKFGGNTFRAWSEGTPEQRKFLDAILSCKCHVIGTMRTKTEYSVETDERGKMRPKKIGLAPRQREGIEYEFDMLMEGTVDHFFSITKDRTGKFQDQILEKPSADFGKSLIAWLSDGEIVKEKPVITKKEKSVTDIVKDTMVNPDTDKNRIMISDIKKHISLSPAGLDDANKKAESLSNAEFDRFMVKIVDGFIQNLLNKGKITQSVLDQALTEAKVDSVISLSYYDSLIVLDALKQSI